MQMEMTREEMLSRVYPEAFSLTEDKEIAEHCPYAAVKGTDLAMAARVQHADGTTELVNNAAKSHYRLTEDEIMRAAVKNMNASKDHRIAPMNEMLGLPEDPDAPKLLVVSNRDGRYGAAEVFSPEVQREAARQLGGDYYVLPSSKHECILISADCGVDRESLQEMVRSINESEVSHEDKLSDTVYRYDFQTRKLGIASEMETETKLQIQTETMTHGRRM